MTKKHCDFCDRVIEDNRTIAITLGEGNHSLILAGAPTVDACKYCIIDALNKTDDRPKAKKP
jgi:hypothetical protein